MILYCTTLIWRDSCLILASRVNTMTIKNINVINYYWHVELSSYILQYKDTCLGIKRSQICFLSHLFLVHHFLLLCLYLERPSFWHNIYQKESMLKLYLQINDRLWSGSWKNRNDYPLGLFSHGLSIGTRSFMIKLGSTSKLWYRLFSVYISDEDINGVQNKFVSIAYKEK